MSHTSTQPVLSRRQFNQIALTALATGAVADKAPADDATNTASDRNEGFKLKYLLASCMYGYQYIGEILPELKKTASAAIDLWPKVHGNQREQLADFGEERFQKLLSQHGASVGCLTQYPFSSADKKSELAEEIRLASRLGADTVVTGGHGPHTLKGAELKSAVRKYVEGMKPVVEVAEDTGVRLAIENHGHNLIASPDSLKWLAEFAPSRHLAIAFAPYHLPQDAEFLGELVDTLGDSIALFYAWQHGMGCMKKLPKEQEMLQLPGRGDLDFAPMLAALRRMNYAGWTEVFMHPVPRGIPILETTSAVTDAINETRQYLENTLKTNG